MTFSKKHKKIQICKLVSYDLQNPEIFERQKHTEENGVAKIHRDEYDSVRKIIKV